MVVSSSVYTNVDTPLGCSMMDCTGILFIHILFASYLFWIDRFTMTCLQWTKWWHLFQVSYWKCIILDVFLSFWGQHVLSWHFCDAREIDHIFCFMGYFSFYTFLNFHLGNHISVILFMVWSSHIYYFFCYINL